MARTARASRTFFDINDGDPGLNNATVSIFQRSETQPTTNPTATLRYTFATGVALFEDPGTPEQTTDYVFGILAQDSSGTLTPSGSWGIRRDNGGAFNNLPNAYDNNLLNTVGDELWVRADNDAMLDGTFASEVTRITIQSDDGEVVFTLSDPQSFSVGTNERERGWTIDAVTGTTTVASSASLSNRDWTFTRVDSAAMPSSGFTDTSSNNWFTTISEVPDGAGDIWFRQAAAIGTGATDDIEISQWSGAAQAGSTGANGAPGLNSATVYRYQRTTTNSAPNAPTSTDTYTFATTTLSPASNNSWLLDIPAASAGEFIWIIAASVSGIASSEMIAANTWSEPVLLAQRGDAGTNGLNTRIDFAYADNLAGTSGFSTSDSSKKFRGTDAVTWREGDTIPTQSTTPADYEWSQWTGDDGDSITGASGQSTDLYRAWANTANGDTGFSTTYFEDALYEGTDVITWTAPATKPTQSTTNTDYEWTRIRGNNGENGRGTFRRLHTALNTPDSPTIDSGFNNGWLPAPLRGDLRFNWETVNEGEGTQTAGMVPFYSFGVQGTSTTPTISSRAKREYSFSGTQDAQASGGISESGRIAVTPSINILGADPDPVENTKDIRIINNADLDLAQRDFSGSFIDDGTVTIIGPSVIDFGTSTVDSSYIDITSLEIGDLYSNGGGIELTNTSGSSITVFVGFRLDPALGDLSGLSGTTELFNGAHFGSEGANGGLSLQIFPGDLNADTIPGGFIEIPANTTFTTFLNGTVENNSYFRLYVLSAGNLTINKTATTINVSEAINVYQGDTGTTTVGTLPATTFSTDTSIGSTLVEFQIELPIAGTAAGFVFVANALDTVGFGSSNSGAVNFIMSGNSEGIVIYEDSLVLIDHADDNFVEDINLDVSVSELGGDTITFRVNLRVSQVDSDSTQTVSARSMVARVTVDGTNTDLTIDGETTAHGAAEQFVADAMASALNTSFIWSQEASDASYVSRLFQDYNVSASLLSQTGTGGSVTLVGGSTVDGQPAVVSQVTRWMLRIGEQTQVISTSLNTSLSDILADLVVGINGGSIATATTNGSTLVITDGTASFTDADGTGTDGIELAVLQQGSGGANVGITTSVATDGTIAGSVTHWRLCITTNGDTLVIAEGFLSPGETASSIKDTIAAGIPDTYFRASRVGNFISLVGNLEAPIDAALEFDEDGVVSSVVTSTKNTGNSGAYPTTTALSADAWSVVLPFAAGIRSVVGPGVTIITTDDQVFTG